MTAARLSRPVWPWALLLLAVAGAVVLFRVQQLRASVTQGVPVRPGVASAAMRAGIESAEEESRGWRPVAGLARLARLYHANGYFDEAGVCESRLMELEPSNALWPYLLAHTAGGFGRLEEAIPLLRETLELSPGYLPARIRLAGCLLKTNRFIEAERVYREAYGAGGRDVHAALGLARVFLATGRPEEARAQLREAAATHPKDLVVRELLESLEAQSGGGPASSTDDSRIATQSEMPDPWIESLMDICLDPYRLMVAASAIAAQGSTDRAQQLLEQAIRIDPGYAAARRHLGRLIAGRGDFRTARAHLEEAVRIAPRDSENWNYLIKLLKDSGDARAAAAAIRRGLENCPDSPALHLEMGRMQAANGGLNEAMAEFQIARRLRPEEANAYIEIALVHFRRDRLEAGISEVKRALLVEPNHPIGLVLVARYAVSIGDEAAAREWIRLCRLQPLIAPRDIAIVTGEFEQAFGQRP